ncbi:hypothetical protein F511_45903 [Dorcoceras hygrometricum]|uniref:Uncharacterized protein n=1 Tax=Dorcoceras hygrometricum TaxID=472368 RepID=A0A2Z6ZUU4_9LAMI|nr:hypothetical protein F511_45903 [Dorcoceras hygrometricum]
MAVAPLHMAAPQRAVAAHVARPMLRGRRLCRAPVARSVGRCAARWPCKSLRDGRPCAAMRRPWRVKITSAAHDDRPPPAKFVAFLVGRCAVRLPHDDRAPHVQDVAPLDGWTPHWLRAAVFRAWRDDSRGRASRLARRCVRPCVALGATSCAAAARFFVVAEPPTAAAPAMS